MSFDLRNIREVSNEPQAKFINHLARRLNKFLNDQQTEKLENKEDIYSAGQDVDTVVKWHSDLGSTKTFDFETEYYPPFEPDGDKVRVWVRGTNLGNTMRDWAEFGHTINLNGDPTLVDGAPFDLGIHTGGVKSIALRLNRPTSELENSEYISIPDSTDTSVEGISTGISYFIRFKIKSLAQQGSYNRNLFEKIDDSTPNNGVKVCVDTSGRLMVYIKRSGTEYNNQTATSTITVDTVYEVFITYAVSGNVVKVYVNNVDKSLTDPGSPTWHTTLTNHDTSIFRRGAGSNSGYTYGDLYDYIVYREKVVSTAEVGYHYTNKWTIADIPYGQVCITNYFATWIPAPQQAYTTAGYTSTGYNV
jgi:hypothetical protein